MNVAAYILGGLAVVVFAFGAMRRPDIGLYSTIAIYMMIPTAVYGVRVGSDLTLPIGGGLTVVLAVSLFLRVPRERSSLVPIGLLAGPAAFVVLAFGSVLGNGHPSDVLLLMVQVALPFALFIICLHLSSIDIRVGVRAAITFVIVAVCQASIAVLVSAGALVQPFSDKYAENSWWDSMYSTGRMVGISSHPLDLGLMLSCALPLLSVLPRATDRLCGFLVLCVGIVLTQSRAAIAAMIVCSIYFLIVGCRSHSERIGLVCGAVGGVSVLAATGRIEAVSERLSNDSGSAVSRGNSFSYVYEHISDYYVYGVGMVESKAVLVFGGMPTSAESAVLCYVVGYGVFLTVVYFGSICSLIAYSAFRYAKLTAGIASSIVAVVLVQFYSSVSTTGQSPVVLWLAVAFAVCGVGSKRYSQTNSQSRLRTLWRDRLYA
ncbi:O-antigen ligase family protein [Gordonia sputi]